VGGMDERILSLKEYKLMFKQGFKTSKEQDYSYNQE
jgi:hypothetical protein